MRSIFCLRAAISIALRAGDGPEFGDFGRTWGGGFNAELEVGWPAGASRNKSETTFATLIRLIDHKHLGFDAPDLGITTPESLLLFCSRHLRERGLKPVFVRLRRGEEIAYELSGES